MAQIQQSAEKIARTIPDFCHYSYDSITQLLQVSWLLIYDAMLQGLDMVKNNTEVGGSVQTVVPWC